MELQGVLIKILFSIILTSQVIDHLIEIRSSVFFFNATSLNFYSSQILWYTLYLVF